MRKYCPLCEDIKKRIHLGKELNIYYEDDLVILADALTKRGHQYRVMVMSKEHIAVPSPELRKYAREIAREYLPFTDFINGHQQLSIPDHYHEIYSDLKVWDDHYIGMIKKIKTQRVV